MLFRAFAVNTAMAVSHCRRGDYGLLLCINRLGNRGFVRGRPSSRRSLLADHGLMLRVTNNAHLNLLHARTQLIAAEEGHERAEDLRDFLPDRPRPHDALGQLARYRAPKGSETTSPMSAHFSFSA